MSLMSALREQLTECRRAGKSVEMGVLQVVLGEASTLEARSGKPPTDEELEKVIRKTILGNQETLGLMEQKGIAGPNRDKLVAESAFMQTLLPKTLGVDEIVAALGEVADAVK